MILTRESAANIDRFTQAVNMAFAFDPVHGFVWYGVDVELAESLSSAPTRQGIVGTFQTKAYSQEEMAQVIAQFWEQLVLDGLIGNTRRPEQPMAGMTTLTGNPMDDLIRVSHAFMQRVDQVKQETAEEMAARQAEAAKARGDVH